MPKTGFSNGFANLPGRKYYKYHGWVRECNTEPRLLPFMKDWNGEIGSEWVRLYCNLVVVWPYFYLVYEAEDVLPSRWPDGCPVVFPEIRERYYFIELYLQKVPEYPEIIIDLNYGNECKYFQYVMTEEYENIAMWFKLNAEYNWIFRVKVLEAAHTNKIWRTSNGNLSVDWPVPIEWKYK